MEELHSSTVAATIAVAAFELLNQYPTTTTTILTTSNVDLHAAPRHPIYLRDRALAYREVWGASPCLPGVFGPALVGGKTLVFFQPAPLPPPPACMYWVCGEGVSRFRK